MAPPDALPDALPGSAPSTGPATGAGTPPHRGPDHPLAGWLRTRVVALRAATRRRVFPGTVELVVPHAQPGGGALAAWAYGDEPTDHALRVDVLAGLLTDCRCRGVSRVALVHVRPGPHEPTDLDMGWAGAVTPAADIAGVEVASVLVVSRWGWLDLATGATRAWVRPRVRRTGSV